MLLVQQQYEMTNLVRLFQLLQRHSIIQKRQRRIPTINDLGPVLENILPYSDQPYQHPPATTTSNNVAPFG